MTFLSEMQHVQAPDQGEFVKLPLAAPAVASVLTLAAFVTPASAHYVNGEYREDVTDANCASTPGCAGEAPLQQQANPTEDSSGGGTPPESIAQCESGGDPQNKQNPTYRGKWQFSRETWAAMGGSGDPADASEAEQDMRAAKLWAGGAGAGNWTCAG